MTTTSPAKSTKRRAIQAISAAGAGAVLASIAGPAMAAPPTPNTSRWISANTNQSGPLDGRTTPNASQGYRAHGFVNMSSKLVYYCAQDVKDAPSDGYQNIPNSTWGDPQRIVGQYTGTEGKYTATDLQEAAYIVNKFGNPAQTIPLAQRARMVTAVDAANGALAGNSKQHMLAASPGEPRDGVKPTSAVADNPATVTLYNTYRADAKKYAGQQAVVTKAPTNAPKVGSNGVFEIGIQSKLTNNYVPGTVLTATLTGGGTFADGKQTKSFTSQTALSRYQVNYTSTATVKLNVTAQVPDFGLWLTKSPKWQNLWIGGYAYQSAASSSVTPAAVVVPPTTVTPTIATQIRAGDDTSSPISDVITGTKYPSGAKVTGEDDLYFVPAGTPIVKGTRPDNAVKLNTYQWSATATTAGNISTTTPEYQPTQAGTYVYQERVNAGSAGNSNWKAFSGVFGEESETVTLKAPVVPPVVIQPKVTTQINAGQDVSTPITDTVLGSEFPAGAPATGNDRLYFVPTGTQVTEANAKLVQTTTWKGTAGADGKFSTTTTAYQPTEAGTYIYVEDLAAGGYQGKTWAAQKGTFGQPNETAVVTKPGNVNLTTKIVVKPVGQNSAVSDDLIGSGYPSGATVKGGDDLYFLPYGTTYKEGPVPANATKLASYKWSGVADAKGGVTANVGTYTATKPGVYIFVESAEGGSYNGNTWKPVAGKFGTKSESAVVTVGTSPKVSTKVSSQVVKKGDLLSDTVLGSGFRPGATASGPDDLYYLPKGVNVGTNGVIPKGAKKVGTYNWTAKADAKGNIVTKTASHKVAENDGTYVYVESLNAGNYQGYTWTTTKGKFGQPSETSRVKTPKPPIVPTGGDDSYTNGNGIAMGAGIFAVGGVGAAGALLMNRRRKIRA